MWYVIADGFCSKWDCWWANFIGGIYWWMSTWNNQDNKNTSVVSIKGSQQICHSTVSGIRERWKTSWQLCYLSHQCIIRTRYVTFRFARNVIRRTAQSSVLTRGKGQILYDGTLYHELFWKRNLCVINFTKRQTFHRLIRCLIKKLCEETIILIESFSAA